MAGRYDFQSRFGGGEEPWFKVGSVDVNTTTAIVGIALLQVMIRVFEGPGLAVTSRLLLVPSLVTTGGVWRIVTWPFVTFVGGDGLFWALIGVAFFWLWGSQLEGVIGRNQFMRFFALLVLGPAILLVLLSTFLNLETLAFGLTHPAYGVMAALAAAFSKQRAWFGLPLPVLVGIFIGIGFIQELANRQSGQMVLTISAVAIGLLGIRAMGHASDVEWLPKLTIPGLSPATGGATAPKVSRPKRSRSRANLRPVPTPPPARSSASAAPESSAEIDALLDKIAESGYDSLTKSEKAQLEAHSKKMRRRNE